MRVTAPALEPLAIGDRVHSRAIGARAAFDGVIVEKHEPPPPTKNGGGRSSFGLSYDVRDEDGRAWNRSPTDLRRIDSE